MDVEITRTVERATGRTWRPLAIWVISPLTVLAGVVWAVAQPYRLTLLDPSHHGVWDHIAQPPLLVVAVGVIYHFAVARPLLRTLEDEA